MRSIVKYNERGVGGNNKYRGNCSPKLITDLIEQFGIKHISDYMCGSGTTKDASDSLGIQSSVYDLNMGFDLLNDDIKERNEFVFWHPPYWDIIKYSGYQYGKEPHPSDISHIKDYNEFMKITNELLFKQYASIKTGGRMAILTADVKKEGRLYSMLLDMIKPGMIEQIVIKEQFNTWSERQSYNGKFIPIVHEYLLILKRDTPYIQTLKVTSNIDFDIRDSKIATWKDVIVSVFEKHRRALSLSELYNELEHHKKAKSNQYYKAKIRQIVQSQDFMRISSGLYELVA